MSTSSTSAVATYLQMRAKTEAMSQPPPAIQNYLRVRAEIEQAFRPAFLDAARSAAAIGAAARPTSAGVLESVRASQAAARAALAPVCVNGMAGSASAAGIGRVVASLIATPEQFLTFSEQHWSLSQRLSRDVVAAAAKLPTAEQIRVRNALAHWTIENRPASAAAEAKARYLAVIEEQIAVWEIDGNRRLKAFATAARRALAQLALDVLSRLVRGATVFLSSSSPPSASWGASVGRISETLRRLRQSLSPNAPPMGPA
jgi:hypothetical protein